MLKALAETNIGDYFISHDEKHREKVFVVESKTRWGITTRPVLFLVNNRLQPSASSHSPVTFEPGTEVSVVKLEIKLDAN